ncbi:MAG TPA: hypothetical protein VFM18_24650, partial [Methanosarcina sp.]|nr:hypothetical protein [Methanosarcina sp.]
SGIMKVIKIPSDSYLGIVPKEKKLRVPTSRSMIVCNLTMCYGVRMAKFPRVIIMKSNIRRFK